MKKPEGIWPVSCIALAAIGLTFLVSGCGQSVETNISLTEIEDELRQAGLTVCNVREDNFDTPGAESNYTIRVDLGDCRPNKESFDEETALIRVTRFGTTDARKESVRQAEILPSKPYWLRLVWDIGPYMIALSNNPRMDKEIRSNFIDAMKRLDDEEGPQ